MKRIVIALAIAVVLGVGAAGGWTLLDNSSVATVEEDAGRTRMVPRAEVEQQAEENFARPIIEEAPDAVSCPRGLYAKKRDTVKCTADFDGEHKPMFVSVTGVKGDRVTFDYGVEEKVHDSPSGEDAGSSNEDTGRNG